MGVESDEKQGPSSLTFIKHKISKTKLQLDQICVDDFFNNCWLLDNLIPHGKGWDAIKQLKKSLKKPKG